MSALIKIVEYSEKSFAVIGDTKEIKDKFKINEQFMGRFNKYLSIKDEKSDEITKQAGWIFHVKHREFVKNIVNAYLEKNQSKLEDVFVSSPQEHTDEEEQKSLF